MKKILLSALLLSTSWAWSQEKLELKDNSKYQFTEIVNNEATPVQNQGRTGTCWSFSALSFFESEIIKKGKGQHVLSEMWIVRHTYFEKAIQYVRMHGKSNFGEGGAFHDVAPIIEKYGIVPEVAYHDMPIGEGGKRNHSELSNVLQSTLDGLIKSKKLSQNWKIAVNGILDAYFGTRPKDFVVNGKTYTPHSYAQYLGIQENQFIGLTSYTHHPFYESFVLEVPDNWSGGLYLNIPIDDMMEILDEALKNGYTVAWASDVSEKGFSYRHGLALMPRDGVTIKKKGKDNKNFSDAGSTKISTIFDQPSPEKTITQEMRQKAFDNYETTDDHGMHITGIAKDQKGNKYYIVKNSWGTKNPYKGYFYASEAFVKYKTMDILVSKEAINKKMKKKLKI